MAFKLSKPEQAKVREMYSAGVKITTIAKEMDRNRDTIAKYARAVDDSIDLKDTPAARFTEGEVELLQGLARLASLDSCDGCGTVFAILSVSPAPSYAFEVKCPRCGKGTRYTDDEAIKREQKRNRAAPDR